jgi:hypothetical protein
LLDKLLPSFTKSLPLLATASVYDKKQEFHDFRRQAVRRQISFVLVLVFGLTSCLLAQDAASGSSDSTNLAGKWQMSWQGRNGQRQGTLQLQQDGSQLTGTLQGERGSVPVTGSVNGSSISFTVQMQGQRSFTLLYTGMVDGDKMNGTIQAEGGQGGRRGGRRGGNKQNHSWTATRDTGNSGSQSSSGNGL